ncbi:MAG: M13 family metallopeptidase [Mucilaginibacter sp.]
MKKNYLLWLAIPAVFAMSCKSKSGSEGGDSTRTVFFDKTGMDTTVKPGDNFFGYANGEWMKKTIIPASQTGWGSFYIVDDDNEKNLHKILEDISKQDNAAGSVEQKVADMYLSGMDTAAMDKRGYDPIKPLLARAASIKDYKDLVKMAADRFKEGGGFLFGFYISPDDRISTKNAAHFDQTGLGLPDRDYYFKTDSASVNIRNKYVKYIAKLFTLTGVDAATADKKAAGIMKLETAIAQSHSTPVELRDPVKNYNKFTTTDFQKLLPDVDLADAFNRMGLKTDTVLVGQPKYYQTLDGLLKNTQIDTWKDKETFDIISSNASDLSKPFRDANFDFYNRTLNGQKIPKDRWKIMIETIDGGLGELLGQLYVAKYFPPDAKTRMLDLVNNLQRVYRLRIQNLDWMSDSTKKKALAKLDAFTKKIGYPDKWKKYDDVTINKNTFFENEQSIARHNYKDMIRREGKPVDRAEWGMTPPTVNAQYNPLMNDITFPAGILQFPFFDKNADDAINYGGIGAVIGHEMTHGFDDQGSQYDKDGNLKNWWTPQDREKFKKRVQVMINQYNQYTVLNGLHVNGELTQGENLADIGGLAIAYEAFKSTPEGKSNTKIDGFTPDQRFFLSFAQIWRVKDRDERLRMRISIDPHSPEMYRVNGPLSNMPAFYKAFNVQPTSKLYRPDSAMVKVW